MQTCMATRISPVAELIPGRPNTRTQYPAIAIVPSSSTVRASQSAEAVIISNIAPGMYSAGPLRSTSPNSSSTGISPNHQSSSQCRNRRLRTSRAQGRKAIPAWATTATSTGTAHQRWDGDQSTAIQTPPIRVMTAAMVAPMRS